MSTKITLLEWFDLNNIPGKRCKKKLQRWARTGRLQPVPSMVGRSYHIEPTAKLINNKKSKVDPKILEQAKSDAQKLMYLNREAVLSHLMSTIG